MDDIAEPYLLIEKINNIRRPFGMTSVCVIRSDLLNDEIDLLLVDVIDNPLTDFLGAIFCATFNLDFGSTYVLSKRLIDSLADESAFSLEPKVLEKHSYGENLSQRVGNIEALALWP